MHTSKSSSHEKASTIGASPSEQQAAFDNSFRKIDVEKFDIDKYEEEEAQDQASARKPAAPYLDEQELSNLINQYSCNFSLNVTIVSIIQYNTIP